MEIWLTVLLIISTVLVLIICVSVYWYREVQRRNHALIQYTTSDTYSNLESEVKFKHSKNTKIWIGHVGLGAVIDQQKNQLLREQYEAYASAIKTVKNWCNLANMMDTQHERKMADELPCIGHRQFSKFYHPMYDEKYGSQRITSKKMDSKRLLLCHYDSNQLPILNTTALDDTDNIAISLGQYRVLNMSNDEQYRAFRLIFETIQHPYIMHTYEVNQSKDKRHILMIRDLEKKGSLRDHIHSSDLSQVYGEKYCIPGKPLGINRIRKYGRQILEALSYLSECGMPCYHLHSGNVIIQNDSAKITEIENVFMGYQLRHPLHQHLCALKKVYIDLDIAICLFGYILFEMATGYESPTASPLDSLNEIPIKLDANITNILGQIFGDKYKIRNPSIYDLINDPFFNAINVPKGDVSMFVSLRNENEMVNTLINVVSRQCQFTYSKRSRAASSSIHTMSGKRKKKKKKKRKKIKKDDREEKEMKTSEYDIDNEESVSKVTNDDNKETVLKKRNSDIFDNKEDEEESSSNGNDLWSAI